MCSAASDNADADRWSAAGTGCGRLAPGASVCHSAFVPEPSATDQPVVIDGVWPDHPELVRLYEAENSGRDDHDFYLALIAREGRGGPVRVVDIGCGGGILAELLGILEELIYLSQTATPCDLA